MQRFARTWLSDPSTYPMFAALGAAVTAIGIYGYRALLGSPDLYFDKNVRKADYGLRDNHEVGRKYTNHALRELKHAPTSLIGFQTLNRSLGHPSNVREGQQN